MPCGILPHSGLPYTQPNWEVLLIVLRLHPGLLTSTFSMFCIYVTVPSCIDTTQATSPKRVGRLSPPRSSQRTSILILALAHTSTIVFGPVDALRAGKTLSGWISYVRAESLSSSSNPAFSNVATTLHWGTPATAPTEDRGSWTYPVCAGFAKDLRGCEKV